MLLNQVSIHSWIQSNQIKTETGQPLDFHVHRYLYDIYRDHSKYLCCTKAGQIGFSTMAIVKTIWLAQNRKIDIGYILPTVDMVQKFVGSKVNRIGQQNPVIQKAMADKDSITQKQIGQNYIHYLGAQTERSAIMLSLDMLVADEYNKAPQEILETYDSRLQHSRFGYKWVFSNPTIPDFGVDRFWSISDMKKWNITHSCGMRYVMDESCVDYDTEEYVCPHCKGIISYEEIRMGEWYNKDDVRWDGEIVGDYDWSGWWIPLWINPLIPATKVCEYKRTKTKEYFANFVAGLSYVNPNDAITEGALTKALSSEVNTQEGRVIIGLDTGHNLHYTMMNKQGVFYHGYCPSIAEMPKDQQSGYDPYTEIENRLKDYKNSVLVADQGGDLIGVRKLQAKYPGRVFLCWFVKETRNQDLVRWQTEDGVEKALADRNRVIQLSVDQINDGRIQFNGSKEDWQPFFDHALNIYRVKEIIGDDNDPQYGWRWVWKRKGADHWYLSMCYALIGLDRFGQEMATFVKKDKFMAGVPIASNANGSITGKRFIRGEYADL